jgi:hypothetical protein
MQTRTWLLVSILLVLTISWGGVSLAQQQAEPPDLRQQAQQDAAGGATLDKEGVIDSGLEVHAAHPDDQHGGSEGHLPPRQHNVKLIGKAEAEGVTQGSIADVNFFGNYAYLAAFDGDDPGCQTGGVHVFNIKNLQKPRQVGFIPAAEGTYVGEGVQVVHLDTPRFEGDVLIHNNEICGEAADDPNGGVSLIDVSNPEQPEALAEGVGDLEPESVVGPGIAHQVHSAFAWDVGKKAYAVLVDDEEAEDVDIMDITDPRNPRVIAEYDLNEEFPQIIQEGLGTAESFFHDVIVKKIDGRWIMLASYWDGGYVKLDVTKPKQAEYLADSDFKFPDPEAAESGLTVEPEGNAHQAEFSLKNNFIVAADEDFSPYSAYVRNLADGTRFKATQGSDTPQIDPEISLEGETVFVGLACNGGPAVPPAGSVTTDPNQPEIAVVERGVCTFTEKVENVEAAGGYEGIIIFNREGSDACSDLLNMDVQGTVPTLFVGRDNGFAFFDVPYDEQVCRAGDGTAQAPIDIGATGDTVSVEAVFDGWGYVHLFRNGEGKLRELDTYAIPEAHDERFAEGFGDLSVHEVAMSEERNDLAYFSYYAGGFRVAKIKDGNLREVGSYIARNGNNFWGVQVLERKGKEYVLASDRDYGLYVFRYKGGR